MIATLNVNSTSPCEFCATFQSHPIMTVTVSFTNRSLCLWLWHKCLKHRVHPTLFHYKMHLESSWIIKTSQRLLCPDVLQLLTDSRTSHSPASHPACRAFSQPRSPVWLPLWCQPAPAQMSEPSSCSAGSSQPCEASLRCGSPSQAWAWWSLCCPGPPDFQGDLWGWRRRLLTRSPMRWRAGSRWWSLYQSQHQASSLGWRSWCSRAFWKTRWMHKRSTRLSRKSMKEGRFIEECKQWQVILGKIRNIWCICFTNVKYVLLVFTIY